MINTRKSTTPPTYQILEPRKLLAGDVTVSVDGSALTVFGDADSNQIQIVGSPDGSAIVRGLDGTTINGGDAEFSAGADLRRVQVQLGEGNDEADIRGLVLDSALTVRSGSGDDSIEIQYIDVQGIEVSGNDGNDLMQFDNVFSHRSIVIQGGDGDDTVAIGAMAAHRNGTISTGNGNDSLAVDNLGIKENMSLLFGNGDDQALIAGETYGYRGDIVLGAGDDSLSILPATNDAAARFRRNLSITGNSGDDTIAMDASVTANRRARIDGGTDNDAIQQGDANLQRSTIRNFESEEVADLSGQLDAFYASLAASNVDVTRFGGPATGTTSTLTVTSTDLSQSLNGDPLPVDDALILTGDEDEVVSGATIAIEEFQDGEEELAFTDTDDITGVFADGTLTLTGDAGLADYQTALRSVTYAVTSASIEPSTRTVDIAVTTGDGDLTGSRTINIEDQTTNEAPVLATLSTPVVMNVANVDTSGNVEPVSIIPSTLENLITDSDSAQLGQAIVAIDDGRVDGDVLAFTEQAGITGIFTETTGVLVFAGDASVEDYEAVLRSVTFGVSDAANIGQRTLSIEVTDVAGGTASAATDQTELRVDVVTSETARVTTSAIAQEFGNGERQATVDPSILVVGGEDAVVTGATVQLSSGYQVGEDELSFITVGSNQEITGAFDPGSGTLTLTGDSSADAYQRALRNVVYTNTVLDADARTDGDRTVVFTVNSDTAISDTRVVRQGTFDRDARDQALLAQYEADNNITAQTTSTGLHYVVETEGNDVFPVATDTVRTNYVGTLLNGSQFDANDDIPFSLLQVIPGWTEGFQFFSEGSSGQLLIPSDLAYGANARDGIPTNSILIFDIDLLDVNPA